MVWTFQTPFEIGLVYSNSYAVLDARLGPHSATHSDHSVGPILGFLGISNLKMMGNIGIQC
ncbi:MAG: hypothetical protein ACI8RW_001281 [Porticoccaceae bacterium]|jgi:hypothetical protein